MSDRERITAEDITHRDGTPWFEAAAPPRRHAHWAQTCGWIVLDLVERCPCGAFRRNGRGWFLLDEPRVAKRRWGVTHVAHK